MAAYVHIDFNEKRFNDLVLGAVENFKNMESNICGSIDIDKCITSYAESILIYHQELWKYEIR